MCPFFATTSVIIPIHLIVKKKKKIPPKILVFPHNFNFIAMNIGHFSDMVLLPEVNSHFFVCFRHIQIQVGIVTPVNKVI